MSIKNNVTLIGRLTKDVELRYTPNGVPVTNFSIAVQRERKNQNGDYECDYPNIVVWQKPAENLANHCKKGDLIGVHGRLQTRSYDGPDGKKIYVTEVVSNSVDFLRVKAWENGGNNQDSNNRNNNHNGSQTSYQDPFANSGDDSNFDDGLPF